MELRRNSYETYYIEPMLRVEQNNDDYAAD